MPASMPARSLSEAPADWLEARAVLLDEDARDDKFALQIEAICKLRDIEERESVTWHASFDEVKAELVRRGLREPAPGPEFMGRAETVAAIRRKWPDLNLRKARRFANLLPPVTEDGCKWVYGRQWYRIADVEAFLRDE